MINENNVIDSYVYFYREIYDKDYSLSLTDKRIININTFLVLLNDKYGIESLGRKFLYTYLLFQFCYWKELILSKYEKAIQFEYIVGKKAFLRWIERDKEYDWLLISKFLSLFETNNISYTNFSNLFNNNNLDNEIKKFRHYNDKTRSKYLNKKEGLVNCIISSTLYSENSIYCERCYDKEDCKKLQLSLYRYTIVDTKYGKVI